MANKHTPGPWRYKPHSTDSNYMLVFCSSREGEGDNLRGYCGEANARLIAEAPELLACLLDVLDSDGDLYAMDFDRYRAAIAKATGENQ